MKKDIIRHFGFIATTGLSAALAGPAGATALTAQQILSEFNLVTTGNVTTQSDIEGAIVDGGNLNAASLYNNQEPSHPDIYVYGTLGGPMNIDHYVNLYYATPGVGNPQVNFNGGHTQYTTLPALSAFTAPLAALSSQLAAAAPTAGATEVNGAFRANGATGLVVFDLTAAQLESDLYNQQVTFSGGPGVTGFIVNVSGDFAEPGGANFNTAQQDALFNFYDASSVTLGNWKTSVLAPTGRPVDRQRLSRGLRLRGAVQRRRRTAQRQSLRRRAAVAGFGRSSLQADGGAGAVDLGDAAGGFAGLGFAGFRQDAPGGAAF